MMLTKEMLEVRSAELDTKLKAKVAEANTAYGQMNEWKRAGERASAEAKSLADKREEVMRLLSSFKEALPEALPETEEKSEPDNVRSISERG